jgi:hypothetical protein
MTLTLNCKNWLMKLSRLAKHAVGLFTRVASRSGQWDRIHSGTAISSRSPPTRHKRDIRWCYQVFCKSFCVHMLQTQHFTTTNIPWCSPALSQNTVPSWCPVPSWCCQMARDRTETWHYFLPPSTLALLKHNNHFQQVSCCPSYCKFFILLRPLRQWYCRCQFCNANGMAAQLLHIMVTKHCCYYNHEAMRSEIGWQFLDIWS